MKEGRKEGSEREGRKERRKWEGRKEGRVEERKKREEGRKWEGKKEGWKEGRRGRWNEGMKEGMKEGRKEGTNALLDIGIFLLDRITNDTIRQHFGVTPIIEKMREGRLCWYGHVQRAAPSTVAKTAYQLEVNGR
ncbi:Immunoglobulin G-binding protein A, partial [Ophiophagus hannah]